jgi:hypothetical protein
MGPESDAEIKSDMKHLVRMVEDMARIQSELLQRLFRIEGVLAKAPQTAEFYELRGRVEQISRRLPATLAYAPPGAS